MGRLLEERVLRKKLQSKLNELGFGMWQKSVYISPFDWEEDIDEFLISQKMKGMAYVFTAKHRLLGDAKELAYRVWKLDELSSRYEDLFYKLRKLKGVVNKKRLVKLKEIISEYSLIIFDDPHLPSNLLPDNWMGDQVRNELRLWC